MRDDEIKKTFDDCQNFPVFLLDVNGECGGSFFLKSILFTTKY